MFRIIRAAFDVFRAGQSVSNPAAWKNAQLVGTLLTALVALVAAFGFDLGLSDEEIVGGAVFIAALANGILVIVTSKKVGLPAKKIEPDVKEQVEEAIKQLQKRNDYGFPTDRNG